MAVFTEQNSNSPSGGSAAWAAGTFASIAAAATTDLGYNGFIELTGSATIGEFSNFEDGKVYILAFATGSAVTLDEAASATIGYAAGGARPVGSRALLFANDDKLWELDMGVSSLISDKVAKAGDTMTGALDLRANLVFTNGTGSFSANATRIYRGATSGLTLFGTGSTYDFLLANKNGTNILRVPTGTSVAEFVGNVGIGTSSPSYRLHVKASSANEFPIVANNSANGVVFGVLANSSQHGELRLYNSSTTQQITLDATDGAIYERGRSVAMGEWTTPSFAAGDYTGGGSMTWTVASGDRVTQAYSFIGKTCLYRVYVATSTLGGSAHNEIRVAVPSGATPAKTMVGTASVYENGAWKSARALVSAGSGYVSITKSDVTNFTVSGTDNIYLHMAIDYEIQ